MVNLHVIGIISPAKTSCGIGVKLTCRAGAGGNTNSSNFLSYCSGLSTLDGPSGLIITGSKFNLPQRLDGSFVAYFNFRNKYIFFLNTNLYKDLPKFSPLRHLFAANQYNVGLI